MPRMNANNQEAFLALVRAGLRETDVQFQSYSKVDYEVVMRLAEEQSVVGLVTAGLEHVQDVKVPQVDLLLFIGQSHCCPLKVVDVVKSYKSNNVGS